MENLEASAWNGTNAVETVRLGREEIRALPKGEDTSKHSTMLSVYIGSIKDVRTGATRMSSLHRKCTLGLWGLRAEGHALWMRWHSAELNHTQLDVLSVWLVRTAELFPVRKKVAIKYAQLGVSKAAYADAAPIERSLSLITWGKAKAIPPIQYTERTDIIACIRDALKYQLAIRRYPERLQDLRQWVRVVKGCGELYLALDLFLQARFEIGAALALAEGPAQSESQAAHLRQLLRKIKEKEKRYSH